MVQPPPGGAGNIFKGMEANRRMRSATTNSTRHGAGRGYVASPKQEREPCAGFSAPKAKC